MVEGAAMFPALALAEFPVAAIPAGRRNPGGEEVGTEGENEVCVLHIEVGENVLVVHVLDGGSVDIVVHRLVAHVLGAHGLGETGGQQSQVAARRLGQEHRPGAAVVELADQGFHALRVPAYGVELAGPTVAAAPHGAGYAVGVIQGLHAGLAAGVALPLVGGVQGVSLDLLGPSLHDADEDALAGRAVAAQAGVPVVLAPHQVFREADRTLDAEFALADAEALAGHGAHGAETGPSQKMSPR